jgi:hypothetical protein
MAYNHCWSIPYWSHGQWLRQCLWCWVTVPWTEDVVRRVAPASEAANDTERSDGHG